jgi:hypothetical protein
MTSAGFILTCLGIIVLGMLPLIPLPAVGLISCAVVIAAEYLWQRHRYNIADHPAQLDRLQQPAGRVPATC